MNFNIKGEKFRIRKNENNKFWKPIGLFINIAEIKIDNQWYKCSIKFEERERVIFIQFNNPMIVDEKTSKILKIHNQGVYFESPTTNFKKQLIQYLLGIHKLNYSLFNLKKNIYERKNTIIIFSFAFLLSAVFFYANNATNNSIVNYVASNLWCQTIIMFLTLASFINIFYPFAIRKELNQKDIVNISKDTIAKEKEEELINEENRKRATL